MRNKFRESNQMSSFFKDIFQQNFKAQKSVFMKYVIFISKILRLHSPSVFNDKVFLLYYNVAVYISVQSDEEYSPIWKAKPLSNQVDKGRW